MLSFDTYYLDQSHLTLEQRHQLNYDHPDTLDVALFIEHLDTLRAGGSIELPVYDFATHTRRVGMYETLEPADLIIVDGILLFAFAEIAQRLDFRIFRQCPEAVRLGRRIARDITERGRTPESVRRQFHATVAPMHDRFVEPSRQRADLVVPYEAPIDGDPLDDRDFAASLQLVLDALEQFMAPRREAAT